MTFALCPDNGPPRLWRFVEDDALTEAGIVSMLYEASNLLVVNRPLFDRLSEMNRHMVLHTHTHTKYI